MQMRFGKSYRMNGEMAREKAEAIKKLEQSISMIKQPVAFQQDPSLTLPKIQVKVSQSHTEENRMEEVSIKFVQWPNILQSTSKS